MATTSSVSSQSTSSTSLAQLDTFYQQQISNIMTLERQPLNTLKTQKDSITIQKSAYSDVKTKLDSFQTKIRTLMSTDSSYALSSTRKATVSNASSGSTVLTATASSTAVAGTYSVQVTRLARQMTTRSDRQSSSTTALGLSGDFTVNGQTFTINSGQSLNDIATMINAGTFTKGSEAIASVVDNRLIIQSKNSGGISGEGVTLSGDVLKHTGGLGMLEDDGTTLRNYTAADDANQTALFKINGTSIERDSNSDITDVISGLTLNLASDAEGKSATLTVADDSSSANTAITSFISEFNTLTAYLNDRVAVTKNDDGTFTRGSLSGDLLFRGLKYDLAGLLYTDASNSGSYMNLSQIGIGLDSSGNLAVTDSSLLETAMTDKLSDVKSLLDSVMLKLDNKVAMFTGDTGYVHQAIDSADSQMTLINSRITTMNERLAKRQSQLIDQYAQIQAAMTSLSQEQSYLYALMNYKV